MKGPVRSAPFRVSHSPQSHDGDALKAALRAGKRSGAGMAAIVGVFAALGAGVFLVLRMPGQGTTIFVPSGGEAGGGTTGVSSFLAAATPSAPFINTWA